MKKLTLNTMTRIAIISVLSNHKYSDITKYNRALKISERVEISPEEREQLHFKTNENGSVSWGLDAEGNSIEGFEDIEKEVELSDDMGELLKSVIAKKIEDGISIGNPVDRALASVDEQLLDPSRDS